MASIEERVKEIIVEQLGVESEEVAEDASFINDLGADSLDTVELVMALEEEFDQEIPDEEAEKLEHAVSETLIMHLDRFLEYPEFDPHGKEIPLSGKQRPTVKLLEVGEGFSFKIISIPDDHRRSYCESSSFVSGSVWQVAAIGPNKETFLVKNNKTQLAFSADFAEKVKVRLK